MKPDIKFAFNKQDRQDRSHFGSGQHNCIPQDSKNSGYFPLPVRNLEAMLLLLAVFRLPPVHCQDPLLSHHVHSGNRKRWVTAEHRLWLSVNRENIFHQKHYKVCSMPKTTTQFSLLSLFSLYSFFLVVCHCFVFLFICSHLFLQHSYGSSPSSHIKCQAQFELH